MTGTDSANTSTDRTPTMEVVLGGTFDPVHDGHRALFERAFSRGSVTVGLTSDEYATETRSEDRVVRPYRERRDALEAELDRFAEKYDREYTVRPIDGPTDVATEAGFEVLVVSAETADVGEEVNRRRRERGHEPLDIEVADRRTAEDGGPISATRIVHGEIDEHGNLTPERTGRSQDDSPRVR